jgi:hypothetical protein
MWECSEASRKLRARRRKSEAVMVKVRLVEEVMKAQEEQGRKGLTIKLDILYILY